MSIKIPVTMLTVGILWALFIAGVTDFEYTAIILLGLIVFEVRHE